MVKVNDPPGILKVLIVSGNQMICAGIRMILETQPRMYVIGEAAVGRKALEAVNQECPQIILIDLDLPEREVLPLIRDLQKAAEKSLILILSSLGDGELARKALCSGAAGIVLKVQPPAVLIAVIESLCVPELQVEREKIRPVPVLLNAQNNGTPSDSELRMTGLTTREREIICLIGKGLKNRVIADRLCISETTVRHHLTNIFSKLELSDRQQLLIWAHRYHLVELTQSSDTA